MPQQSVPGQVLKRFESRAVLGESVCIDHMWLAGNSRVRASSISETTVRPNPTPARPTLAAPHRAPRASNPTTAAAEPVCVQRAVRSQHGGTHALLARRHCGSTCIKHLVLPGKASRGSALQRAAAWGAPHLNTEARPTRSAAGLVVRRVLLVTCPAEAVSGI